MKTCGLLFLGLLLASGSAKADLRLPAILSDHAMLQAGKPVAIWGWSEPGARVRVRLLPLGPSETERAFAATADAAGRWAGQFPALPAGMAARLLITSDRDAPKAVEGLVVGEVWLCGGQSNMVYDIAGTRGGNPDNPEEYVQIAHNIIVAQGEARAARLPVRYFEVVRQGAERPCDVEGRWVRADAGNVPAFSAVAWNFAIALQERLPRPVGLIVSCVGGTRAEQWMPRSALVRTPDGPAIAARYDQVLDGLLVRLKAEPEAISPSPFKNLPGRLYNAMIAGLVPYTLRGVLWYQADGNAQHPLEYGEIFQALIRDWRAEWKEPLPFYFVEMNNMIEDRQAQPVEPNALSILREQQHAGLRLPGVGMVAAIDLGIKNAHFPNKKPVGVRLARLALRDCYHEEIGEVNGPLYRGFAIEGSRVRLKFDDAEGLRVRGGGALQGFALRGRSGPWVWASGRIDGRDIVLWSEQVPAPAAVRYAWAANPVISVENAAGLPLFPFRTDPESKE